MPAIAQRNMRPTSSGSLATYAPFHGNPAANSAAPPKKEENPNTSQVPRPAVDHEKVMSWSYAHLHLCVDECEDEAQLETFLRHSECCNTFQIQDIALPAGTLRQKKEHVMRALLQTCIDAQRKYHAMVRECANTTNLKNKMPEIRRAKLFKKRVSALSTAKATAAGMQAEEVLEVHKIQVLTDIDDVLALPDLKTYIFGDRVLEEHLLRNINSAKYFEDDFYPWLDELRQHTKFSHLKSNDTYKVFQLDGAKHLAKMEVRRALA